MARVIDSREFAFPFSDLRFCPSLARSVSCKCRTAAISFLLSSLPCESANYPFFRFVHSFFLSFFPSFSLFATRCILDRVAAGGLETSFGFNEVQPHLTNKGITVCTVLNDKVYSLQKPCDTHKTCLRFRQLTPIF